ncbi:hypothetical protein TNCV_3200171 [Trichonephila clavipes]|nr:hypothetical protein TNCV_3200171 [Trichonephila clavipes]
MKSRWGGGFCGRNVPILQTGTASHLTTKIKRPFSIVQTKTVRRESSSRTPVSDKDLYLTIPSGHCMHSYRPGFVKGILETGGVGQVCPDVDKELCRLGPDSSGVFWRVMRQ